MEFTLVCFPHAGGSNATYNCWRRFLPSNVRLIGPHSLNRRDKPESVADLWALIEDIAFELRSVAGPIVLYGHSMGSMLALDVARVLSGHGANVVRLFVSGRRAPYVVARTPPIHELPDDEFLEALIAYGGMPAGIAGSRRLLADVLPHIRSDLKLVEHYVPIARDRLRLPISAIRAIGDPLINAVDMRAWSSQTSSAFAYHEVEGDHFVHCSSPALLLELITRTIKSDLVEVANTCNSTELPIVWSTIAE